MRRLNITYSQGQWLESGICCFKNNLTPWKLKLLTVNVFNSNVVWKSFYRFACVRSKHGSQIQEPPGHCGQCVMILSMLFLYKGSFFCLIHSTQCPLTRFLFTITREWPPFVCFIMFSGWMGAGADKIGRCTRARFSTTAFNGTADGKIQTK